MRAAVKRFYLEAGKAIREMGEECCPLVSVARDAGAYQGDCSRLDYVAAANYLEVSQGLAFMIAVAADGDVLNTKCVKEDREFRSKLLEAVGLA
jgi:hypothetical protein